jgi:predicted aspartyl protease
MILPLDPASDLIIVPTRVFGSGDKEYILRFLLDTGATSSILSWDHAVDLGYDPANTSVRATIYTASGMESGPRLVIRRLEALGKVYHSFPVLCHVLPPAIGIDDVLGLDFLRGTRLTIDFRTGILALD